MSYGPTPAPKPAPKPTTPAPAPQNVYLTNGSGGVDRNSVTISGPGAPGGAGSVTWFSNGNGAATIKFDKGDGSPFRTDAFDIPRNGHVNSGPAISGGSKKPFNYSVHGELGKNDPVIVVDP